MLKNSTAAELAEMLESMAAHPHNTGGLSMLDEATMAFRNKNPDIAAAQQAFAQARYAHMRSYISHSGTYSQVSWEEAMRCARELAALLRPLGDTVISRCQREAGWGTCNLPLADDGTCRSSLGHEED